MPFNAELAERVRDILKARAGISEKRMFGGVGFLLNGNMLVGIWHDSLIARLGVEQAEEVRHDPHVGPMDITGKPMKGWVIVKPTGLEEDKSLRSWVRKSIEFVKTMVPK